MPPPRPCPLARAPLVDRLNGWLETAWARGWSSYPSLDPEVLLAKGATGFDPADEAGGRSGEDAADFRLRMEKLCSALTSQARLNPLGRTIAHGQLARVVRQRFALGRMWRDRPEVLETPLAPPIVVVGQMRSGTTRIHRLLAADPAHAATRFCDSWHPVPARPDLRPVWSAAMLAFGRCLNPWLDTIHPFGAARADEELGWLAAALDHCAYEAQWHVPSFTAFSEGRDPAPVYREFARILQTDAAHHHNAPRPRVLKCPQFSEDLPTLLRQFPGARIVVTQRDAADVAKSAVSLVANQMTIQSDQVDLQWIEQECERKLALRAARCEGALAGFEGPLARVDFLALNADPMSEIERVYSALGLVLSPAARAGMLAEVAATAGAAHESHASTYRAFAKA